jgi:predicted ABC-type exoprotein transport system permease subunit
MKQKIENFFQRNLALLLFLHVAITWSLCEYIVIPLVNESNTIAFFVGCAILMYVLILNWKIFKKFILNK